MRTEHINFTEKVLGALPTPTPEEKRITYFDTGSGDGLGVVSTYGGTKTYYFFMYFKNRSIQKKIGRVGDIKLIDARSIAHSYRELAAHGKNPISSDKSDLLRLTVLEFYNNHYKPRHSEVYKRLKSIQKDDTLIRNTLKIFNNTDMLKITKEEVADFHNKTRMNVSLFTANRAITLLGHMYKLACEWSGREQYYNPVDGIKKFKEKSRERFLQPEEIQRFMSALAEEPNNMFKNYVTLSLLLGQRRSNMLSMRWENIILADKDTSSVYFPDSKNGEPQRIPLTNQAYELLVEMQKESSGQTRGWVFPSSAKGPKGISKSGHVEDFHRPWYALLKRADIEDFRIHDLRRTFGSYQAMTGSSLQIIGKSLGDKSQNATLVYSRLTLDPVRQSMQRGTDKMFELAKQ